MKKKTTVELKISLFFKSHYDELHCNVIKLGLRFHIIKEKSLKNILK